MQSLLSLLTHTHTQRVIHTHTHLLEFVLFDFVFRIICTCDTLETRDDSIRCTHIHFAPTTVGLLAVRVIGSCTYCQQWLLAKRLLLLLPLLLPLLLEPQRNLAAKRTWPRFRVD